MKRRDFLKTLGATCAAASLPVAQQALAAGNAGPAAGKRPNVLFIAIDDLNHWIGYTNRNPQARTPNIDRLSKMGVSFTNAHCAAPACNPSRAALMSGMRPSTTACYKNADFWTGFIPEGLGLSQAFRNAGYYAAGAGKIYHSDSYYDSEWDDYAKMPVPAHGEGVAKMEGFQLPVKSDLKDEDLGDWHTTNYCIKQLERKHDKPFFLACGIHKPRLPWAVPRKYYERFPLDDINLPPYREDDLDDIPPAGLKMAKPEGDHKKIRASGRWKAAIQSYLASCAYADMNIGRLLDGLEKSAYAENTIIVFWGDHGWHLGEKQHWRKFALWEEATRTPFIWVAPGVTPQGAVCERSVDFMSIYPTLCDLSGIPRPEHLEGPSIKPLLADPKAPWDKPAICTHGFKNHTVRTEQWRYIRYANGDEELYDHRNDPHEWKNLAPDPKYAPRIKKLAKLLPKKNAPIRKEESKESSKSKTAEKKK